MAELSGEDAGTRRAGEGIDCITIVKTDTLIGYAVHVGSLDEVATIAGHSLGGMVVGHHEDDVRTFGFFFFLVGTGSEA